MYDWEQYPTFTQKFKPGELVRLNPDWKQWAYLNKEYGHLFPRRVEKVVDDVVYVSMGKASIPFARQVLTTYSRGRK